LDLYEVLDQIVDLLRQRGKVTYSALKFQFQLNEEALAVLKEELLYAQPEIEDDKGRGLIWKGTTDVVSTPPCLRPRISCRHRSRT
jgi:hypothetical protein